MRLTIIKPTSSPVLETGPQSIHAVKMLRISLTDRCNYRCTYCMPAEGVPWLPKDDLLTFEEIGAIVRVAVDEHGIRRFKLTGGEPTLRRGLLDLVRQLKGIKGVEDLSLTTNGQLLENLARPLAEAGLDRLTISLDSLKPDQFHLITRTGDLAAVMRGLDASLESGFKSVKINCVMMRGVNDDELDAFARLSIDRPVTVRFIEYMPLGDSAVQVSSLRVADDERGPQGGCGAQDRGDVFISEAEAKTRIESHFGRLQPVDRQSEPGVGPAIPYQLPNAAGRIGFISAMSAPFCSTCNRLRLTATGVLRSCLFEGGEVDLKPILRSQQRIEAEAPTFSDRAGDGGARGLKLRDAATEQNSSLSRASEPELISNAPFAAEEKEVRKSLARAMVDCVRLKPEVHSRHGNEQMSRIGG